MMDNTRPDSPDAAGIPQWTFLYDCSVSDIRQALAHRPARYLLDIAVGADPSLGRFIHSLGGIQYVGMDADPQNLLKLKSTFLQEMVPFGVIRGSILELPAFGLDFDIVHGRGILARIGPARRQEAIRSLLTITRGSLIFVEEEWNQAFHASDRITVVKEFLSLVGQFFSRLDIDPSVDAAVRAVSRETHTLYPGSHHVTQAHRSQEEDRRYELIWRCYTLENECITAGETRLAEHFRTLREDLIELHRSVRFTPPLTFSIMVHKA